MVNLSTGKPKYQYSKFRKSLSLFSFRFISVAALWWPAKSCEFPVCTWQCPWSRFSSIRWHGSDGTVTPVMPSRSSGITMRSKSMFSWILPQNSKDRTGFAQKTMGAVGWLIWWFHWKVRRATPISPTWWKLWCDSGNWAKGQRIEGTRAFMRVSFPDMILYHQTQNWLIGVKTPETVRPDKKPLLVTCFFN